LPWEALVNETPVDIVRRLLSDPTNPELVSELVAEDSVYVSLNSRVAVFGKFTYTSTVLKQEVTSPFAVLAKVENGKVVYTQFMEDSFATARSFRSGGAWMIQSDADGPELTV
jgi:hypothetical protein